MLDAMALKKKVEFDPMMNLKMCACVHRHFSDPLFSDEWVFVYFILVCLVYISFLMYVQVFRLTFDCD